MPIHDAYARITPFELAFPPDRFDPEELGGIRDEIEESEQKEAGIQLGLFLGLDAVGRILARLREPDASAEDLQRHGILLYHAFHFDEAGRPLYFLSTPAARYLVDSDFGEVEAGSGPVPPVEAGYLQLPRNLFWIEATEGGPPEPVDGLFWSTPDGSSMAVLVTAGIRPDRGGYSVVPIPRLPLEHSGAWVGTSIREGEEDFSSDLPGAELEHLYSIEATGEVLKLLARAFAHLAEVPGCAVPVEPHGEAVDPNPSALAYRRIELIAPEEGG